LKGVPRRDKQIRQLQNEFATLKHKETENAASKTIADTAA